MEPPRVLLVMGAQWPRALIRAALEHAGYDAVGAATVQEALSSPAQERGRGPVRLIILAHDVAASTDDALLGELQRRHSEASTLVLQSALHRSLPGTWTRVLRHPVSIAEIVQATEQLLPL